MLTGLVKHNRQTKNIDEDEAVFPGLTEKNVPIASSKEEAYLCGGRRVGDYASGAFFYLKILSR